MYVRPCLMSRLIINIAQPNPHQLNSLLELAQLPSTLLLSGVASQQTILDAGQLLAAAGGARGHAAADLAVDVAHILLERRVGDAAGARGDGPVGVVGWRGVGTRAGGQGGGGEEGDDGDKLHFDGG
jgi:hypothetical protein